MKKLNLRELRVPIILAAVVLLAVLILTITVSGHRSRSDRAAVEAGITYLEAQEARDPAQVDEILRLRREEQLRQERAQLLEDLSTGDGRYFELFDVTVDQGSGDAYYSLKPSIGTKIAKAVLGETGSIRSELWETVPRLNGTELKFQTAADVPEGAKVLVAAYDSDGKLIRCLVTDANGHEKPLTVPEAADYKVFLLSKDSVPLTEALTDFN